MPKTVAENSNVKVGAVAGLKTMVKSPYFGIGIGGGFAAGVTFALIPIMVYLGVTYMIYRLLINNPDENKRKQTAFNIAIGLDAFMLLTSFYWYLPARILFGGIMVFTSGKAIDFFVGPYNMYAAVMSNLTAPK